MDLKALLAEAIQEANEEIRNKKLRAFKRTVQETIEKIAANEARKEELKEQYVSRILAIDEESKGLREQLTKLDYKEHEFIG